MTIIKGKGFVLRPIKMSDAKAYFETMQDKETKKGFMTVPKSLQEAKKEIKEHVQRACKKTSETFAIDVDGEYAGYVKIDHENWDPKEYHGRIHYCTHPKFRGKGITTKAVKLVTEYAFKRYKFKRIVGRCRSFNKASARVLEKAGYKLEGIMRKDAFKDGKYYDNMIWAEVK
jgi:ribosomal-protein-alanine N-acetyltransferase